jgi:hypothetical protein
MCDTPCPRLHLDQTGGQGADIARYAWAWIEHAERRNGARPPLSEHVISLLKLLAACPGATPGEASFSVGVPAAASLLAVSPARAVQDRTGRGTRRDPAHAGRAPPAFDSTRSRDLREPRPSSRHRAGPAAEAGPVSGSGKRRYRALRATPITRATKPARAASKTGAAQPKPGRVTSELVARGILPKVPRGRRKA